VNGFSRGLTPLDTNDCGAKAFGFVSPATRIGLESAGKG
jgi:hypothetical protein